MYPIPFPPPTTKSCKQQKEFRILKIQKQDVKKVDYTEDIQYYKYINYIKFQLLLNYIKFQFNILLLIVRRYDR